MKKKGVVLLIITLMIIAVLVVVGLFSCGAFSTPKLQVYELVAKNEVVKKSREGEEGYAQVIFLHKTINNSDDLEKVNNLVKNTTYVIEELTPYVLFVRDTGVSDKKVQKTYEEYISAKNSADAKLKEALKTSSSANWEQFLLTLVKVYSNQAEKYNEFAQELLNYTINACFANNPKTVKFTTLSFMQGFNNFMINEYVSKAKLSNNTILGISINESIYKKYIDLKKAEIETLNADSTKFVDSFYVINNLNGFYNAYSKGANSLKNYIFDPTNFDGKNIQIQKTACENVYNFITSSSFIA